MSKCRKCWLPQDARIKLNAPTLLALGTLVRRLKESFIARSGTKDVLVLSLLRDVVTGFGCIKWAKLALAAAGR